MERNTEGVISIEDQDQSGADRVSAAQQARNAAVFREIIRALGQDSDTFQTLQQVRTYSRKTRPTGRIIIPDPPSRRTRRRVQE